MTSTSLKNQKPIIDACQIIGVLPYNSMLETSKVRVIYSLLMCMITLCLLLYSKMSISIWDIDSSKGNLILDLMNIVKEFSDLLIIVTHIGSLVFRRKKLQKFIIGIKFLELRTATGNASPKLFYIIFNVFIFIIVQITCFKVDRFSLNVMFESISMECPYLYCYFIAISFSIFIEYLRTHLDHIANCLEPNEKTLSFQVDLTVYIFDLCTYVNRFYSMQMFIICFRALICLILFGHLAISSVGRNIPEQELDLGIFNVIVFNMFHLTVAVGEACFLVSVCRQCTNIQKTVELFNNKLFNLMREHKDLCSNDKLHLYLTMKQTVNFTACGFFSIGKPLVTTIIATATTYLVILLQFNIPAH